MRSENQVPLTLEEHRELGREMKKAAARLRELCGLVIEVYGPQSAAGFRFQKAMEALEHLNQELETQATRDLNGASPRSLYL
jgi:hypothetical protein